MTLIEKHVIDKRNIPSWPNIAINSDAYQKMGSSNNTLTPTDNPHNIVDASKSFTRYRKSKRSTVAIAAPIMTTSTKKINTLGRIAKNKSSDNISEDNCD